ncbi:hypothetical protein LT679_04415 [Mucilaginibacter roseus]|uniref:Uncharacterized protein n=1 Tax=Mucilaginibacter roseus TaxID=1528868 RepID=A0ABS8TYA1_9SPHI|nr:hypothetical protein [Mucilaginibacter roseus]MCD8739836.1 hypothetical protein [Mucilaginibacter roseus]
MSISTITITAQGGPLTAIIESNSPVAYTGAVWRYKADKTFDQQCGFFRYDRQEVQLGAAAAAADKLFLVKGVLINQGASTPIPYELQVSIFQDGNRLYTEVPKEGGSGAIDNKALAFIYRFKLQTS